MSESETSRDERAHAFPLEIDSGTRFKIMDATKTYVIIYCATANSPPGFTANDVYYCIKNALPTSSARLELKVEFMINDPGFSASEAVSVAPGSFQSGNSPPPASSSLWVHHTGNFALGWGVTGTLSSASGTAQWWHDNTRTITPSSTERHTLSNNTSVNSSVTCMAEDALG